MKDRSGRVIGRIGAESPSFQKAAAFVVLIIEVYLLVGTFFGLKPWQMF